MGKAEVSSKEGKRSHGVEVGEGSCLWFSSRVCELGT